VDFNFSRDTRDNLFDPRYGSYVKLSTLVAGQVLSGTNSFVRFTADYRRYRTLNQKLSLAGNAFFGFLFETTGARGTPIYERFYAGGDGSIRGYRDRVVGPKLNGDPIGGNFKFVLRGEARLGVIKNFHTALFLDIGNVWTDISAENLLNIKSGTGLGLRYKTPLGVVRLDYGLKIDKLNNIDYGRFHFSIGQAL
jgi:outer membrane protein insertion porin family